MVSTGSSVPAEEAEQIEQLQAGDEAAFERLIRDHGGRMLVTTRRILHNEEDAQDAVQEAFLSAFKSIERFHGQSQLGTWLHRIAINAALMRLRSQRRRKERDMESLLPSFTEEGGHFVEPPSSWSEPADAAAQRHEVQDLVRASIEQLPDNYRIPLLLRDIEELDNSQVAEHLDVTVNAAKIRVHRARQALKALLDPHMGPGQ